MGLTATKKGKGSEPVPQGQHHAVCYGVVDLGQQLNVLYSTYQHKVMITWEIPALRIEIEKDGEKLNLPKVISKEYTLSLSDKANLKKDLTSWRGKAFTPVEEEGFEIFNLLGVNCIIQVIHKIAKTSGNPYAIVDSIMALPKGMEKLELENPIQKFSFEDGMDIPDAIPEWITQKIIASTEYETMLAAGNATRGDDSQQAGLDQGSGPSERESFGNMNPDQKGPPELDGSGGFGQGPPEDDSDIPF